MSCFYCFGFGENVENFAENNSGNKITFTFNTPSTACMNIICVAALQIL